MPQFTVATGGDWELHPEGVFPATLVDWVPIEGTYQGQTTERIQWKFETSEEREDGTPHQVSWFTSYKFGSPDQTGDKKSKLRTLCEMLGVYVPETNEEAAEFNPSDLVGGQLRVKIVHKENSEGNMRAIIFALMPLRPAKAASGTKAPAAREQRNMASAAAQGAPRPQPAAAQRARAAQAAPPPDPDADDPFAGDEA